MKYLVWSIEHNAWWAPNRCGYVQEIEQAGRYDFAQAMTICAGGNVNIEKVSGAVIPNEAIVPIDE